MPFFHGQHDIGALDKRRIYPMGKVVFAAQSMLRQQGSGPWIHGVSVYSGQSCRFYLVTLNRQRVSQNHFRCRASAQVSNADDQYPFRHATDNSDPTFTRVQRRYVISLRLLVHAFVTALNWTPHLVHSPITTMNSKGLRLARQVGFTTRAKQPTAGGRAPSLMVEHNSDAPTSGASSLSCFGIGALPNHSLINLSINAVRRHPSTACRTLSDSRCTRNWKETPHQQGACRD